MNDPSRPVRRRLRTLPPRGLIHLTVVSLMVGSVAVGVVGAKGALADDGSLLAVAPVQAAVNEQVAAVEGGEVVLEVGGSTGDSAAESDGMDGLYVVPTPPPDPVAAIPLPAPPPVRTGGSYNPSLPWSGPTGYVDGDGSLAWPVPGGYISQYFWSGHKALDIADSYGSAVVAADTGTVISSGWMNNGGGLVIMIQHSDGRVTGYNHLGAVSVSAGQAVIRGQRIASVGCTGMCTGPHVHFQVIVNGVLVNPLRYL